MNILKLYSELDQNERFVDETFIKETYFPVKPQLTIIDGGAYRGEFDFYCLPFAKVIYAFEPDPRPFHDLDEHVKNYQLGDVIKHSNKALANTNGKRFFYNSGFGGSTMFGETTDQTQDSIEVETITLATVIKDNKLDQIDILKLDMENAEEEVLASPDLLEYFPRIKMIIGEHLQASDNLLKNLGYKSYTYAENTVYTR